MHLSTAKTITADVLSCFELLNKIVWELRESASEEEFNRFRGIIATVIASLDLDILAKIYREHPELEKLDPGLHPKPEDGNVAGEAL
jgi:hypothetical protein